VNRDFALENCETSAIGIACKNAGIGTEKHSISREEAEKVERVKAGQTTPDDNLWNVDQAMTEITTKLGGEILPDEPMRSWSNDSQEGNQFKRLVNLIQAGLARKESRSSMCR
jgi:hypothetical protein